MPLTPFQRRSPFATYQFPASVQQQPSDDETEDYPQSMSATGVPQPIMAVQPPPMAQAPAPQEKPITAMQSIAGAPQRISWHDRLLGVAQPPKPVSAVAANGATQLPAMPEPRKPGILQRIGAGALGAAAGYVNAAGRTRIDPEVMKAAQQGIMNPGYGAKVAEYNRQVQQIQAQNELNKDAAQMGHQQAQGRLATAQADALDREGKYAPNRDYMAVGGGLFNAKTGQWVKQPIDKTNILPITKEQADAIKVGALPDGTYGIPASAAGAYISAQADKPVKTIEEALVSLYSDPKIQPEQKKARSEELVNAFNVLHPKTPIHVTGTDAQGNMTLVIADPANPTSVKKVPLGKIGTPQQAPGASQPYSPQEIRQNDQEMAQGIVDGDPISLKNFSLRGDHRGMILGLAKKLAQSQGKPFDPTLPDRQIEQLNYFSNGKGADAIQSFDTFLQHAAEAKRASEQIERLNAKYLNKPVSWWRENMANDPAFAAYLVALEPVGKEFESFLLNGRALYTEDRVKIDKLINENQPLKSQLAVLKQLATTAKDRYTSINQRYRNLVKKDIPAPWSPAAVDAANSLGISLGASGGGGQAETITTPDGKKWKQVGGQMIEVK